MAKAFWMAEGYGMLKQSCIKINSPPKSIDLLSFRGERERDKERKNRREMEYDMKPVPSH